MVKRWKKNLKDGFNLFSEAEKFEKEISYFAWPSLFVLVSSSTDWFRGASAWLVFAHN
jgi:hypothetical protein